MLEQIVRGPLLIPQSGGHVDFHRDGALAADATGALRFAGDWRGLCGQLPAGVPVRVADGVMLPPLLDIHTHVPQHPIRGRFVEGVPDNAPGVRLLEGLRRNVFPAEARCNDEEFAEGVVREFLADTLSHGIVGGAAYMTPSAAATEAALTILPEAWSVGLVMMNQNCPPDLCTDAASLETHVEHLATRFGRRLIVTDRFAVAVTSALRQRGVALAARLGLRTQTHLNEQTGEKLLVESTLHPQAASYADVYRKDGLLQHQCIVAHCIHMRPAEWQILLDSGSAVAHCPTSNTLLGSGVMALDDVMDRGIPYAIGTDVGASPTVSMLAEIARFLQVHEGRSTRATPSEALCRSTLATAEILGLDKRLGRLAAGYPMSFIEAMPPVTIVAGQHADDVIRSLIPRDLAVPEPSVFRVTLAGQVAFERSAGHA